MQYRSFLVLVLFIGLAQCDDVKFKECSGSSASKQCTVHRLVVDPCPEAKTNKPCVLKQNSNASIAAEITVPANIDGWVTKAYSETALADLPLVGMDTVACNYMQCPTTGERQNFNYKLPISKSYPPARYLVKWKIWKDEDVLCCFLFRIKIEK